MPNLEDCRQFELELEEGFNSDVPAYYWTLGTNYSPPNLPSQEPIEDLVAKDLKERARRGIQKYGHALHESKDDMLNHLYNEILDAASYLRTLIEQSREPYDPKL